MDISQEYLKSLLDYNPDTGVFTWIKSRKGAALGNVAGVVVWSGYRLIQIDRKTYRAHRLAFLWMTGSFPPKETDHINGIRNDNRWCNLRAVTGLENSLNKRKASNNTSGVMGVTWHRVSMKWQASIKVNQRSMALGYYKDFFEAVCARKSAETVFNFHPNHGRT